MDIKWIPYQEVDFSDSKIVFFNIDTRDFYCVCSTKQDEIPDISHIKEYNLIKYLHTPEEVKALLDKLFTESGGKADWRMLCLDGDAKFRTHNWQMKYMTIYRYPQGLGVFGQNGKYLFSKHLLSQPVNKEALHTH